MRHEPLVFMVVVGEIGQIKCEVESRQEILEVAGKAGVDGVSLHIDDACVREYRIDDSEKVGVHRRLIDYSERVCRTTLQNAQTRFSHLYPDRPGQNSLPYARLIHHQSFPK